MNELIEITPATIEAIPNKYLVAFNDAINKAVLEGFTVIRGTPKTLLLDLDTPEDIARFEFMKGCVWSFLGIESVDRWKSRSGVGEHVVLGIDRALTATERIILQMALGSDRIHEMLSLTTGVWEGNPEPSVLFKPPIKALPLATTIGGQK